MSDWFEAGLLDLGHKVTFSDSHLESGAINILWDCFAPHFIRELRESGVTYGIAATEVPDGVGFNWRTEPSWHDRFSNFNEAAKGAAFIWAQIECTMPYYAQFAPTTFTALGFSDRLVPNYIDQAPERDFCFFGLRTPYREEAIARVRRYATVEWPDTILSPEDVGRLIARSRIGISFKQSPNWPVPSPPRLGRLMLAKRGVAAEHVSIPTQQGEIVGLCPPDRDFTDHALGLLASDWRRQAELAFDAYREQMPMMRIIEQALDESLIGQGAMSTGKDYPFVGCSDHELTTSRSIRVTRDEGMTYLGQISSFSLVQYRDKFIAIPFSLGTIDPTHHDVSDFSLAFDTKYELEQAICAELQSRPEESPLKRLRVGLTKAIKRWFVLD